MDGFDDKGKRQRRTVKTRSWSQAQARLTEFEGGRVEIPKLESAPQLDAAIADYLADCRARKLEPSSIVSYTKTLSHLAVFFPGREPREHQSRRPYPMSLEPDRC